MSQYDMESKVYSALPVEDDHTLHRLTSRMQEQASLVKTLAKDPNLSILNAEELADTVLAFLRISGWSRPN